MKYIVLPKVDVKMRVTERDFNGWKSLRLCSMTSAKMYTGRNVKRRITTLVRALTVENEAE